MWRKGGADLELSKIGWIDSSRSQPSLLDTWWGTKGAIFTPSSLAPRRSPRIIDRIIIVMYLLMPRKSAPRNVRRAVQTAG